MYYTDTRDAPVDSTYELGLKHKT